MTNFTKTKEKLILANNYSDAVEFARSKGWSDDEWCVIANSDEVKSSNSDARIFYVNSATNIHPKETEIRQAALDKSIKVLMV